MRNDWLTFIIAVFAVYRVGRMVAEEDGPMFLFKDMRDRFTDDKSSTARGLRCFYCVSFWIALPAALLLVLVAFFDPWLMPIWWFGLAGAACKVFEFWKAR